MIASPSMERCRMAAQVAAIPLRAGLALMAWLNILS